MIENDRDSDPITINGVRRVSVADVRWLCGFCEWSDKTDIEYISRRVNALGVSFLNQHWCGHPDARGRQALNAKNGNCSERVELQNERVVLLAKTGSD